MTKANRPMLVTFDGEARSGKGTIAQVTKDFLRDVKGYTVMLIDRGQTFRALVVAAQQAGVDLDNPAAVDAFLAQETNIMACVQFVKEVYKMTKEKREALLYTNAVSVNSAKIGTRPGSQSFVKKLTKKWMSDAKNEGYQVVLIDGRALETVAREMDEEGLCEYRAGLYFVCNPQVGARRTLGYAKSTYQQLSASEKSEVDELVEQIRLRNHKDRYEREDEEDRLLPPTTAETHRLPSLPAATPASGMPLYIIDTSAELSKEDMSRPVATLVGELLAS